MSAKEKKKDQKLKGWKILIIILIVFILVPILILGLVYNSNDNFKMAANEYLIKLPGPLGKYFESYPTKEEFSTQITKIANYLISIDENRAKDKLTLIKNEDKQAYNKIINIMLDRNPNRTSRILEEIRKSTLKEDVILSTIEDIELEKENEILEKVKHFESLSKLNCIDEINKALQEGSITYKELSEIFERMDRENSSLILRFLDKSISDNIINSFSSRNQKDEIRNHISAIIDQEQHLINMAKIYETETIDVLAEIIGNTQTYSINELSIIYKNIGVIKGAQVLSKIEDNDFVYGIINNIKEVEILMNDEVLVSEDLIKAVKIYKDYDKNVDELSKIYEKMPDSEIAQFIKQMYRSNTNSSYNLSHNNIIISDQDIAISLLKKFSERKIGSILSFLDINLSSEISKKLAMPTL